MTKSVRTKQPRRESSVRLLLGISIVFFFYAALLQFYQIAWGTGNWLGQFSLKWALAFFLFALFCIFCVLGIGVLLWAPHRLENPSKPLISFRNRLGWARWAVAAVFLLVPVYFLQYTFWGKVLHEPYLRILLAGISSAFLAWVLTREETSIVNWQGVLIALVLTSGVYAFFVPLIDVTSYPFSLGWSEGNRLWDYSILFGSHLYNYPPGKPIPVLLETGRQFIGGIPFLFEGVNIWQVRLWLALLDILPYLILGWAAFRLAGNHAGRWILAGIWAFTFVRQGPIHPPLLICAIVVALAWKRPLWLAVPLIAGISFFAEATRFTWLFAPGMWAAMLELSGAAAQAQQPDKKTWFRAISVGIAGVLGGYVAPFWFAGLLKGSDVGIGGSEGVTVSSVSETISDQPLLWYRLFPNATYGQGILIGVALAVLPLIIVLIYLARTGRWRLNRWQMLAIVLPLLAFLVVGLIVSVKIGGGGDLHNMDMFLIGLMFAGAVAWRNGGYRWVDEIQAAPGWIQLVMLALILIPGYQALMSMNPRVITEDRMTVATLADIVEDPLPNPLPDTLPSEEDTVRALERLREAVTASAQTGDVLFMDQRQLLTFGYIQNIPLVPEYDKKMLINEALSGDAAYFEEFYQDLASHRFSLIVTNPVNMRLDKGEGHFADENNAWVKWVTTPLLCYYEPLDRLKRVDVELLVPRQEMTACDQMLPTNAGH